MGNKDIFDDEDKNRIQSEYDTLLNNLLRCNKPEDKELIDKAFKIAFANFWKNFKEKEMYEDYLFKLLYNKQLKELVITIPQNC